MLLGATLELILFIVAPAALVMGGLVWVTLQRRKPPDQRWPWRRRKSRRPRSTR